MPSNYLFSESNNEEITLKNTIEIVMKLRCCIYTLGQRCKDWFLMRIFRLTGTSFALGLLSSNHYRLLIGMNEKQNATIDED